MLGATRGTVWRSLGSIPPRHAPRRYCDRVRAGASAKTCKWSRTRGSGPCKSPPPARDGILLVATCASEAHYAVLGLEEEASTEEIKRAFRRAARSLHPDVNPDPQAAEQFMDILRAYQALSDSKSRTAYDLEMGSMSARAKDPRFARFERWRREVVPILEAQLADWDAEVGQIIEGWVASLDSLEQSLLDALIRAQAALQAYMDGHTVAAETARIASAGSSVARHSGDARDPVSRASQEQGPAEGDQAGSGGGYADLQRYMQRLGEAGEQLQAAVQAGPQRMTEYVEKRFEQVLYMFPAYPELVWEREWYDTSDAWLDRMELAVAPYKQRAQRRVAEARGLLMRHQELQKGSHVTR